MREARLRIGIFTVEESHDVSEGGVGYPSYWKTLAPVVSGILLGTEAEDLRSAFQPLAIQKGHRCLTLVMLDAEGLRRVFRDRGVDRSDIFGRLEDGDWFPLTDAAEVDDVAGGTRVAREEDLMKFTGGADMF